MTRPGSRPAPLALALTDHVRRHANALSAEVDGEVVALDIAKGVCYGLDAIGARIWAMIETPAAIGEICDALTAAYDVDGDTCRADVLDLLATLRSEGLIEVAPTPASGALAPRSP